MAAVAWRYREAALALGVSRAYVIVTHNLGQAQRVSDQAMILFDGRVVEAGPTARLFAEPRTELARNFLSGRIGWPRPFTAVFKAISHLDQIAGMSLFSC